MPNHPHTVIAKARELYIKYQGRDHRAIEHEMHLSGCLTFTRRVLYNRTYKNGKKHIGWIDQYGWREELARCYLSHTKLNGKFTLRLSVGSIRVEERHLVRV
jgi:hypothetical protein